MSSVERKESSFICMTACRNIVAMNYNWAMINRPHTPWLVVTRSVIKEKDVTLASFLSWAVNGGVCSAEENSACPTNFSMATAVMSTQHCPQAARGVSERSRSCEATCARSSVSRWLEVCHNTFHERRYLNASQLTKRPSPLTYINSCRISWISYPFIQNFKNFTCVSG